jgi:IclR family acetate operon transcriptional repressor
VEQQFHIAIIHMARQNGTGTQAIERAAQLLVQVLQSEEPLGVGELALATDLPKSTCSRLLRALELQGLIQRDGARGNFRAGPVLHQFARRAASGVDLVAIADATLSRLAELTGETINLAVPSAAGVEHIAQRESKHFLGSSNWVGRRAPYHSAANGKVLLAYGAARIPRRLERYTEHTIVDRDALEAELEKVRLRGYATAAEELEPGLVAVAAPVHGADGEVVAALSLSAPTVRMSPGRLNEAGQLLIQHAAALSARLGYREAKRGAA